MELKPIRKHPRNVCYDYGEITKFVEKKYGIKTRGYKQEVDGVYRDFWHWLIDEVGGISNECYFTLPGDSFDVREEWPDWVREIMALYDAEFFPDSGDRTVWVWW